MHLQYKFVTPLTSMVVTKPESPEKPVESALEDADAPAQQASQFHRGQMMHGHTGLAKHGHPACKC